MTATAMNWPMRSLEKYITILLFISAVITFPSKLGALEISVIGQETHVTESSMSVPVWRGRSRVADTAVLSSWLRNRCDSKASSWDLWYPHACEQDITFISVFWNIKECWENNICVWPLLHPQDHSTHSLYLINFSCKAPKTLSRNRWSCLNEPLCISSASFRRNLLSTLTSLSSRTETLSRRPNAICVFERWNTRSHARWSEIQSILCTQYIFKDLHQDPVGSGCVNLCLK